MKYLRAVIGYGMLIGIAIGFAVFLYWLYSVPTQAVSVSPNPIPVLTKTVPVGDQSAVIIKLTRCKNIKAKGRVIISLVGQTVQLALPVQIDDAPRSCETDVTYPIPLPPQTTPGMYHFHFRATYQANPIRSIIQEYDTQEFEVK